MTYRSRRAGFNMIEPEYDGDEGNFRCPGCELNTGNGRYCDACRDEWERDDVLTPAQKMTRAMQRDSDGRG